jgi:hypothetical protein
MYKTLDNLELALATSIELYNLTEKKQPFTAYALT